MLNYDNDGRQFRSLNFKAHVKGSWLLGVPWKTRPFFLTIGCVLRKAPRCFNLRKWIFHHAVHLSRLMWKEASDRSVAYQCLNVIQSRHFRFYRSETDIGWFVKFGWITRRRKYFQNLKPWTDSRSKVLIEMSSNKSMSTMYSVVLLSLGWRKSAALNIHESINVSSGR